MSCTEKEAAERWCPSARVLAQIAPKGIENDDKAPLISASASFNRQVSSDPANPAKLQKATACLGSRCMFWRWERAQPTGVVLKGRRWETVNLPRPNDAKGFCGLVGQP